MVVSNLNFQDEIRKISREIKDRAINMQIPISNQQYGGTLGTLIQACKAFVQILEIQINQQNQQFSTKNANGKQILLLGTSLVFQLRQFFTQETLNFVISGQTNEGQLKERIATQNEIFSLAGVQNSYIGLKKETVNLTNAIASLKAMNVVENQSLMKKWKKVLKYGFTDNYKKETEYEEWKKGKNQEGAYHKPKDNNVWLLFANENGRDYAYYYYAKNGEDFNSRDDVKSRGSYYNKGWMYQWLKSNPNVPIADNSSTPLEKLMKKDNSQLENNPGIKGGDFGLDQYKYYNRTIISYKNLKNILIGGRGYLGIIKRLEILAAGINGPEAKNAYREILKDFTLWNDKEIDLFVNENFNDVFKNFQKL